MGHHPPETADVLSLVFLHLPLKTLIRCKAVCRVWSSVITDPSFSVLYRSCSRRSPRLEYAGFFSAEYSHSWEDIFIGFVGNGAISEEEVFSVFRPGLSLCRIRAAICGSSNGVILVCSTVIFLGEKSPIRCYFVCNPLTREWRDLPLPPQSDKRCAIGFSCREGDPLAVVASGSKYEYQIVRVLVSYNGSRTDIQTFSSKSNKWLIQSISSHIEWNFGDFYALVISGVFYWVDNGNNFIAYCPTTRQLGHAPVPPDERIDACQVDFTIGETADGKLLGYVAGDEGFDMWIQCDADANGRLVSWQKKCSVKWEELGKNYPPSVQKLLQTPDNTWFPGGQVFSARAFPGDPEKVLVIGPNYVLFSYNLRSKKLEPPPDDRVPYLRLLHECYYFPYHMPSWHFHL